jgi:hypothetical protein
MTRTMKNLSQGIAGVSTECRTGHHPDNNEKCHCLRQPAPWDLHNQPICMLTLFKLFFAHSQKDFHSYVPRLFPACRCVVMPLTVKGR